nr:hypothetical protein GCM10025699_06940 [Microbacterium flavescens]
MYIARLVRTDTGGDSHILFVVRNDGNRSDVVFQTSDPTWQAYNPYGGSDFYQGAANGRAYKISYNRPITTRGTYEHRSFYFSAEYASVRFLERNGYDVSYIAGVDTDRRGGDLRNHKAFLSVGHDEYWSGAQRANMEAARDAGVNLQFLSGNEGYWRTRYEPSADASHTPYRTLVSYKETWSNAKIDPTAEWTGTWRDPRFASAAQGGHKPENALTGTMYTVNDISAPLTVTSSEGKLRMWRNTGLNGLSTGGSANLGQGIIGYESDEDVDNGMRPHGLIRMSTTNTTTTQYMYDYGSTVAPGPTRHNLTMYRAPSGALVFSAGTVQWGWGLDDYHDGNGTADSRLQQSQVNLFADMGVQPGTLMAGLAAATKSTDATAPTTVISSPTEGQTIPNGTSVTATGTASDVGGRVAGVEVSTDGGATWRVASGTSDWSFSYIQQGDGPTPIKARAIDDSANYSVAATTRTVNVTGPYSGFGSRTPATASAIDSQAVELGLRFTPAVDGFVTAIRFFKGSANTGTHTGSLWNSAGERIGSVIFRSESATGWQTAEFAAPVAVVGGTAYTVSYTASNGGYAIETLHWPYNARASYPVTVASNVGTATAGVYGEPGQRPTLTWSESNYFVDVLMTKTDTSPLRIASRTPAADSSSIALDALVTATFTRAADPGSVSVRVASAAGTQVAGTASYDAQTKTVRFAPAAPLDAETRYTVSLSATDMAGIALADPQWSFVTRAADRAEGACPCSLFNESRTPTIASETDGAKVVVGVGFTPAVQGRITAIRFYKGSGTRVRTRVRCGRAEGRSSPVRRSAPSRPRAGRRLSCPSR